MPAIKRFGMDNDHFPYGTYPMSGLNLDFHPGAKLTEEEVETDSHKKTEVTERYRGKLLRYLRQQAKYLTPGDGITVMSLIAVILRGALLSLFVYFGLMLLVFVLLKRPLLDFAPANINLAHWLAVFYLLYRHCSIPWLPAGYQQQNAKHRLQPNPPRRV